MRGQAGPEGGGVVIGHVMLAIGAASAADIAAAPGAHVAPVQVQQHPAVAAADGVDDAVHDGLVAGGAGPAGLAQPAVLVERQADEIAAPVHGGLHGLDDAGRGGVSGVGPLQAGNIRALQEHRAAAAGRDDLVARDHELRRRGQAMQGKKKTEQQADAKDFKTLVQGHLIPDKDNRLNSDIE
jgi:hypothetical protein